MFPCSGKSNSTKRHGAMSSGDVSIGNQVPTMSPCSGKSNSTKQHGAMSSGDMSIGNPTPTMSPCSGQTNSTKRHGAISHTTSIFTDSVTTSKQAIQFLSVSRRQHHSSYRRQSTPGVTKTAQNAIPVQNSSNPLCHV